MADLIILATPTTFTFVQSNHLYAGGDPDAFHSRFPAPVIPVVRIVLSFFALQWLNLCFSDADVRPDLRT